MASKKKKEPSKIKRIRRKLDRDYGCIIYEKDFNLAIRFPVSIVKDIEDEDMELARESLEITGVHQITEKTVTAYIITDKDFLELEVDLFLEATEEGAAQPIHDAIISEESQKITRIDERMRKLIDECSQTQGSKAVKSTGGQAKIKESYTFGGRGRVVGHRKAREGTSFGDIALIPSIKTAAESGSFDNIRGIKVKHHHLKEKIYRSKTSTALCIVVDTSFFSDDKEQIRTVEAIIRTILTVAYEKRYHVGLVTYSGNEAEMKLPFTTDVDKGYEVIKKIKYGGLTPLPSGMKKGIEMLEKQRGDRTGMISIMVLITRGKANVPLYPGGFVRREIMNLANLTMSTPINPIVVHIGDEEEYVVKEISLKAGARYYKPPLLSEKML